MRVATVIGARPQFIKASVVSEALREFHDEILINTGQHYDFNMADIFFDELQIPKPDYNLCIGSGNHGFQTGQMLIKLEEIYLKEKPDIVMVYGDTNSTLAGALCASKLLIPVVHIEAGVRSFNKSMPEEQNRILTDHISDVLFVPTVSAEKSLLLEGIAKQVYNVGDVMLDSMIRFKKLAEKQSSITEKLSCSANNYILATIHRAENTNNTDRLKRIVEALNESGETIVLPLHPRTKKYIESYGIAFGEKIKVINPVGYLDMVKLEMDSKRILTDSGGVQKEAYFMKKPCITVRDETEWVETVEAGWNVVVGTDKDKIIEAIRNYTPVKVYSSLFGDGKATAKIVKQLNIFEKSILI